ncbi:hypothetical protein BAZMOX_107087_1 [methanotrophic endosymbiont of Bathymodiolus azoricus (Menez Gwen)]|nr:hypothetical protein BAZMOX_107087_1 [methanotrophic endosymbiont of Bathymodiolus azoricus (Menez Gwen)]
MPEDKACFVFTNICDRTDFKLQLIYLDGFSSVFINFKVKLLQSGNI